MNKQGVKARHRKQNREGADRVRKGTLRPTRDPEWDRVRRLPQPAPHNQRWLAHWTAVQFLAALVPLTREPSTDWISQAFHEASLQEARLLAGRVIVRTPGLVGKIHDEVVMVANLFLDEKEVPSGGDLERLRDACVLEARDHYDYLTENQREVLDALAKGALTRSQIAEAISYKDNTKLREKVIGPMVKAGYLRIVGSGRDQRYALARLPAGAPSDLEQLAGALRAAVTSDRLAVTCHLPVTTG